MFNMIKFYCHGTKYVSKKHIIGGGMGERERGGGGVLGNIIIFNAQTYYNSTIFINFCGWRKKDKKKT